MPDPKFEIVVESRSDGSTAIVHRPKLVRTCTCPDEYRASVACPSHGMGSGR